jgi:putative FmdB family regulatory protein
VPTYSYACTECDDRFDVVQAFTDDTLTTCEKCSGRLRKLFNSVGVVFKGSGFYRTDSRESTKKAASANGSSTTDSGSSEKSGSSESSGSSEKSASGEKSSDKSSNKSSDKSSDKSSSSSTASAATTSS